MVRSLARLPCTASTNTLGSPKLMLPTCFSNATLSLSEHHCTAPTHRLAGKHMTCLFRRYRNVHATCMERSAKRPVGDNTVILQILISRSCEAIFFLAFSIAADVMPSKLESEVSLLMKHSINTPQSVPPSCRNSLRNAWLVSRVSCELPTPSTTPVNLEYTSLAIRQWRYNLDILDIPRWCSIPNTNICPLRNCIFS